MRVAGLISGTSVDGIDVAVIDIAGAPTLTFDVVTARTVPFPPGVRDAILSISNATAHIRNIALLNFLLGELFADAVLGCGVPRESIELIGSHGQTVFHQGEPADFLGRPMAATLQIGEGAVIAERTGIPVISDFRVADIAAGGKGAPLVPRFDFLLLRSEHIGRIALNIGGIANITVIPARAAPDQVVAFDTGPGNMIIDALTGGYDRDGIIARGGEVDAELLRALLSNPYYAAPPPKTAGREQYGADLLRSLPRLPLDTLVATATELTVQTIAQAVHRFPDIAEVVVSGGGARNLYMMERLRAVLRPALKTSDEFGVAIDHKEAVAFAVLAHETWHGRPGNMPSATGAIHPVILGKTSFPRNDTVRKSF